MIWLQLNTKKSTLTLQSCIFVFYCISNILFTYINSCRKHWHVVLFFEKICLCSEKLLNISYLRIWLDRCTTKWGICTSVKINKSNISLKWIFEHEKTQTFLKEIMNHTFLWFETNLLQRWRTGITCMCDN